MFSDQIEKMKSEYTDKYVVVDGTRPELARFRDLVGRVKTVNMSGRALVEFDEYHLNIAWYDIAPEFLKVVDKPPPRDPKAVAKKAAPKAPPTGEPASAGGKPAAPAKGGKQSVADILAAARGGAAKPAAKPAAGPKMSVAEMIAAAKAGGAPGAAPAAKATPPGEPASAAAKPAPAAPAKKAAAPAAKSSEKVDKSKMTIADMVAWCREHDTK
jgi:hypothetical protein